MSRATARIQALATVVLLGLGAGLFGCAGINSPALRAPLPGDYQVVGRYRSEVDGRPELLVVFCFECEHSYRLAQFLPEVTNRYVDRLRVVSVPVFWGRQTSLPAKLFHIADRAGRGEQVKMAIFRAHFEDGEDIDDLNVLRRIAGENGLADHLAAYIFAEEYNRMADEGGEVVEQYGITTTPSAVMNRSLLVTPTIAGGTVEQMRDSLARMLRGRIGW